MAALIYPKDAMMKTMDAIGPLSKVALNLKVNNSDSNRNPASRNINFDFVCGLAAEGLTAFEKDLHGKAPGDQLALHVTSPEMVQYFEHLTQPLLAAIQSPPPFDLTIEVSSVTQVSDRELVQALARKSDPCGGGCDCGCGCE